MSQHPATLTRQAADAVIRDWIGDPGPLLGWAVGAMRCGHECLTTIWDGNGHQHPGMHRGRKGSVLSAFSYSLEESRAGAEIRWWSGRRHTVPWDEVTAIIGGAAGPDLRVMAAAIRVLEDTPRDVGGQVERDLRVLALAAWEQLRPLPIVEESGGQFALEVSA